MSIKDLSEKAIELIQSGKTAEALKLLLSNNEVSQRPIYRELMEISGRLEELASKNRGGLITPDQQEASANKIRKSFLDTLILWREGNWQFGTSMFQKFANAPDAISRHIYDHAFKSLIQNRTQHFVGRDFIFKSIEEQLQDPDFPSGYIVIQGEPGIGKTALMGELVNRYGYIHHFNIAPQGIRSPQAFLSNICAQLIVRYQLDHYAILPETVGKDSGFLSELLREAAEKEYNRPLVLLVDALDEAEDVGLMAGANRLFLPPSLPQGVYFIISTRSKYDYRLLVDQREDIYLRDDDPNNLNDVLVYVSNFLQDNEEKMSPVLEQWNVDNERFAKVLVKKSQGNFMYLVHVLRDIRKNQLTQETLNNIRNLPQGLRAYYQQHWRNMEIEDKERFEKYYKPVICLLAAFREPATVNQLTSSWEGLDPLSVMEVLKAWREFLDEEISETGEPRYRIYHASFQDFLREDVGLKYYNESIAQSALDKIIGFKDPD